MNHKLHNLARILLVMSSYCIADYASAAVCNPWNATSVFCKGIMLLRQVKYGVPNGTP